MTAPRHTRTRMVLPSGKVLVLGPRSDAAYEAGGGPALLALLASLDIDPERACGRLP